MPAAAEGAPADPLPIYWEHFFKAETGNYEKSAWLDLFLAEFIVRVNEGANPKDLIKFCPVSGVVSLVGCELLCGIHRVTSSMNTHYSLPLPSVDKPQDALAEDSSKPAEAVPQTTSQAQGQVTSLFSRANAQSSSDILRKYLLSGVAWRCLLLLKTLGVEGVSCCRQLSSVLIWVFGELGAVANREDSGHSPATPLMPLRPGSPKTPIHQLFSQKIWSKQKLSGGQGSKSNSVASSEKNHPASRSRLGQTKSDSLDRSKRKLAKQSDHSSETAESNDDLHIINRSIAVKVCTPQDDFTYFDSPIRSDKEYPTESLYSDPYYTPRKPKPKANDYMNDKHKEIINSEISAFDFTLMVTDLLQQLCRAESSLTGSEGSQISMQCINFSLRNLCSLQFGSLPIQSQYDPQEVSKIKVALTELLIVSLDKVLIHPDLCAKLINNGILPMLLRLLEDVIGKYHSKEEQSRNKSEPTDKTESDNLLKFIFGIGYSITAFFHCLLMQCRSLDKLREFTDQFKLYGECLKGGLLKDCIELMIRIPGVEEDSVLLIKKLLESIGRLISAMKRVRSEVVHSAACPRSRHKVCRPRVIAGMHHHHDILGEAGTGLPMSSACCISVLYGTLTSLVTDDEVAAQSALRTKILKVMLNCGVCCCFSPGFLMESIVRLMLTHSSVATLCLQLLEHTVYGDLGASVLVPKVTDQLPCVICEPCEDKRDLIKKYCPHGVTNIERKSVWAFLIHYNSLLQLDNHNNILHATVSHLLRVTPKCRVQMKYELLFSVIYPTFIVAKHRYMIRLEESAYFLTVACLNIFASLLNSVSFAEQFIQKGGLSYVLELVSLSEFSNQCCSILEIAIVVEIFKLMKENADMTYFREISSLSSVQMLFQSLSEMTDKCYNIYKLKLPADKFEELCDVSKERETLAVSFTSRSDRNRKVSMPKPIRTMYASSENVVEESIEDYIEVLKNIWTFWKTCAGLCLYSPLFRQYVVTEPVFLDSYALLKVILHCVCHGETSPSEMRILIKIMESLLTVQFAVSEVTGGRSKDASCRVVRGAVSSSAAALRAGGALRPLCDALIRVALARPSRSHAMPHTAHAKVPPLTCASGSSSADCSSSEDSAGGPYDTEHSGNGSTRPDTGYEADEEIGQLDLRTSYRSKKMSTLSAMSAVTGVELRGLECAQLECAVYSKGGELAHPELCLIVVDILTQLIHKVVKSPSASESAEVRRVGLGLARACCLRLSAGGAPPNLLSRLLKPAAATLLATKDDSLAELQTSILELIEVLASQSISTSEVCAFLRLFTWPSPPLSALLHTLHSLVTNATPHTPDCILTFPVDIQNKVDMKMMAAELSGVSNTPSQSVHAEAAAAKLHQAHIAAGIKSCWSCGAVRCGVEGGGWAAWLHGFSLQLWLRTAKPPHSYSHTHQPHWETEDWQDATDDLTEPPKRSPTKRSPSRQPAELSHLVSLGHDTLMFEVWLDTATGYLKFRLSRPDLSSSKVVSECGVWSGLQHNQWSCLALSVTDVLVKRRMHIQVTVFVNGCQIETVALPLQGILVRKVTPHTVILGDCVSGGARGGGVYHVSHVTVFRAPTINTYSALHLAAHGPDHTCRVKCEAPNYPLVLTPDILDSNIDWDQMFEISASSIREVHDSVLLTFSAHAPAIFNLYHQTAALPTVFGGRVGTTASLMGAAVAPTVLGGGAIPEALAATWQAAPLPSAHRGLPPALRLLGGPPVLLYLVARVVELSGTSEEQALAVSILLRACRADDRLFAQLYSGDELDLLLTIFASPLASMTHHMLKAILDEACTSPMMTVSGSGVSVSRTDAVIVQPELLVLLMRAWKYFDVGTPKITWEVECANGIREPYSGSVWVLFLCCISELLRDDHPRRDFNHYQATRLGLLPQLLTACKERFLNSEAGEMGECGSQCLVSAVRALLGTPPLLDRLAMLADLLLLMHQAKDTFVTHSRANFYFLVAPEAQDTSTITSRLLGRRRSRRARLASDVTDASSSSLTSDTSQDARMLATGSQDVMDHSSVDSAKVLKGIINMQIKEGRKHHMSSTSDYSVSDGNIDQNGEDTVEGENSDQDTKYATLKNERDQHILKEHNGNVNKLSLEGQIEIDKDNSHKVVENDNKLNQLGDETDFKDSATEADYVAAPKVMVEVVHESEKNSKAFVKKSEGEKQSKVDDSDGIQEENGFVVVGGSDTQSNAGDGYSASLYKQRGVRAGADAGWTACAGLVAVCSDCVASLPEPQAHSAHAVLSSHSLLALANHRAPSVRAALLTLVDTLHRRAPPDLLKKLKAQHYYIHLANQIALYPPSWELVTACVAFITKCDVPLEDQLDADIWEDLGEDAVSRSAPLLALLPACLTLLPSTHSVAAILYRLIEKSSLKALSTVCMSEVLVRTVVSVGALTLEEERRDVLLRHVCKLLAGIALKALISHHSMQSAVDIHHMLLVAEASCREAASSSTARSALACRAAQVALYIAEIDHLEDRLHASYTQHAKYTNYFTTVLSSAVSLGTESASRLERSELSSRHLTTAGRALAHLLALPADQPATVELPLLERLLATLLTAVGGNSTGRNKWWSGGGGEWSNLLAELFWWAASPCPATEPLHPPLLRALYTAPPHAVHALTNGDPSASRKVAVYVLTMLQRLHGAAECSPGDSEAGVELSVSAWARGWAVAAQAALPDRPPAHLLRAEGERLRQHDAHRWHRAAAKHAHNIAKSVLRQESLAAAVTEGAMSSTRAAVEAQNAQRKAFLQHLRLAHSHAAHTQHRWRTLVEDYTHQRGVWHEPGGYPSSWALDATEGPGRVRVRLRRKHLDIPTRFLKPHARHKAERRKVGGPLRKVLGGSCGLRGGLVAQLQPHETVAFMTRATSLTVHTETRGEMLLSDRCIHFVPEDWEDECDGGNNDRDGPQSWPLEAVTQVCTRRWCLREVAVELFLNSGHAHLIAFHDTLQRDAFLAHLATSHLPNRREADTLSEAMSLWRSGAITNWEYLMRLNSLAGRTYNDLMQYPVLPFVLADYTSKVLDLTRPESFRDLTKPMAVQDKKREQHYINTYNDLKAARGEGCSALVSRQPHHYASLYSNSGGVLHFLVRLPPFTQLFLNYQDNNFDMPDRTFHSLATTWRLITRDSPTDVKELIPELFYLPELFHNNEGLDLGVRQCGLPVDSVELPPWAADARLFTLLHRHALEAPIVSDTLPHWIDLVFGYKQTGQAAVDAINVFPACTYYGFDPSVLEDEVDRTAAAAMVRTYGQAPRQLLAHPHPQRAQQVNAQPVSEQVPPVWDGAIGARWGSYCGSPESGTVTVRARRALPPAPHRAHRLPAPRAAAIAPTHQAPVHYPGESGNGIAILSWGHSDGVVRLKRRRDMPPDLILQVPALDQITASSSWCGGGGCSSPVVLGHLSGAVLALAVTPGPGGAPRVKARQLMGHSAAVSDVSVCARAALLATASEDGVIVLWDLNTLTYIRTLPNRDMLPVRLVTISETLCDVATVHDPPGPRDLDPHHHDLDLDLEAEVTQVEDNSVLDDADSDSYEKDDTYKYKSLIRVHTVNARFVGSVKVSEEVTCICYSSAPEGLSVNSIVVGLRSGGVKLYSSWELRPVATIPPAHTSPLVSLTYSSDCSGLVGCHSDGLTVWWEGSSPRSPPPRLLPAHLLL